MRKDIIITYQEINNFKTISDIDSKLINKALDSAKMAYAPYSNFNVGAALILENGEIFTGNNQENTSFPCGVCGERVALFNARSKYPSLSINKIAITAICDDFKLTFPVGPCGLCRQVLIEYEEKQKNDIEILLFNTEKIFKIASAKDLLPLYFQENRLKKLKN